MTQNQQQTQWNPSTNQSWATGLLWVPADLRF
jgi:hypothetical protein